MCRLPEQAHVLARAGLEKLHGRQLTKLSCRARLKYTYGRSVACSCTLTAGMLGAHRSPVLIDTSHLWSSIELEPQGCSKQQHAQAAVPYWQLVCMRLYTVLNPA